MSEELRQRGYIGKRGVLRGLPVGPYEGFDLGATTIDQGVGFHLGFARNLKRFEKEVQSFQRGEQSVFSHG